MKRGSVGKEAVSSVLCVTPQSRKMKRLLLVVVGGGEGILERSCGPPGCSGLSSLQHGHSHRTTARLD